MAHKGTREAASVTASNVAQFRADGASYGTRPPPYGNPTP